MRTSIEYEGSMGPIYIQIVTDLSFAKRQQGHYPMSRVKERTLLHFGSTSTL